MSIASIYRMLLRKYGKQNWWPMSGKFEPPQLEVCIGAILTQNTNWKNVEKALENLIGARKVTAKSVAALRLSELEKLIKPSGFYRQKAKRVKEFCRFAADFDGFYENVTREQLLSIKGIGKETADSILLYACSKPYFVIDAYTRRLLLRERIIKGDENYDTLRALFENKLPKDIELYKEFHALIVEHEKRLKTNNKNSGLNLIKTLD